MFYICNAIRSLISIVLLSQAQKERLRQRNDELEDERSVQQQQMSCLQSQVKELSADNVKLYEKIRFLQGYQSSSGSENFKSRSAAINIQSENIENRYQPQYEQRLDPFRTFSNQERQRRYVCNAVNSLKIFSVQRLYVVKHSNYYSLLIIDTEN